MDLQLGPWYGSTVAVVENLLSTDACTMPTDQRPLRLAEFDDLFAHAVRSVEFRGRHVRLGMSGGAGLAERVRDLTEREAACCSFFTFTVEGTDEDLILAISVPPARQDLLNALARRAQELSARA